MGQFDTVWKHDFTVVVQPDGSFTGAGNVTNGQNDTVAWTESITGTLVTTDTTTTPGTVSVKNHGQFVKAQGGGKAAAQACAGMPLNSTQGK